VWDKTRDEARDMGTRHKTRNARHVLSRDKTFSIQKQKKEVIEEMLLIVAILLLPILILVEATKKQK